MGLKAQKSRVKLSNRIKESKEFSNIFRVLGTLTEIMTKKMVNSSRKIPGHFQDKTLKMVNSRTKQTSRAFPGFPGFPGRVDTLCIVICMVITNTKFAAHMFIENYTKDVNDGNLL